MRTLTNHIVEGDSANQLTITVEDAPGQGGACHEYRIRWPQRELTRDEKAGLQPGPLSPVCAISFQNGPIKEFGVNGITQEALLAIVIDRLRSFQAGPFACESNAKALAHTNDALYHLQTRTRDRIARGVEGVNAA